MYVRKASPNSQAIILVSALRPSGRQAMTAAHELGHHAFGHGTRIDQYVADTDEPQASHSLEPEEVIANMFAAFFLMPKATVEHGFTARGWSPASATPAQVFAVAGWLGVGYGALVYHMKASLGMLSAPAAKALLSVQPKRLRQQIVGRATSADCFLLDQAWTGRPLDLQVDDLVFADRGTNVDGDCLLLGPVTADGRQVIQAVATGLGRVVGSSWATFARVRPRGFVGRSMFRHLESAED